MPSLLLAAPHPVHMNTSLFADLMSHCPYVYLEHAKCPHHLIQPNTATDRVTFIEYYSKYLAKAASLLAANAPASAMRLFDREHQNIHEVVRWASQNPPPEALPFYSDILWDSMPLLSGRLDLLQREIFCKVSLTAS